jgi:hypothetical protein
MIERIKLRLILPWFLCFLEAVFVLWLLYHVIDQAVTIDHQIQRGNFLEEQRDILVHVLNGVDTKATEKEVKKLLQDFSKDPIFDKSEDRVLADRVLFYFRDDILERVSVGE